MSRTPVTLRDAVRADAPRLALLWGEILGRRDQATQHADLTDVIARADANPVERLVVAEYDGELAGAVYLRAATLTPLNVEPVVQAVSPHVFPQFRRRGVGRALMEAAATFAEERGIAHVGTASLRSARDANRFLARLGLGQHAVLRVGSTATLRARLTAGRPGTPRTGRQTGQVLAARRSMRRSQSSPAG